MFFALPNLASYSIFEVPAPWDLKTETPPDYDAPDAKTWGGEATVNHAFLSMYEGTHKQVRIAPENNPPFALHGIIADYDALLPADTAQHILQKNPSVHMPTHLVLTTSRNARLIWQFEEPILYTNKEHWRAFLNIIATKLKLRSWLGGFDTNAYSNAYTYFELGREWTPIHPEARIPQAELILWFCTAAEKVRFDAVKEINYKIPIEDLEAEVHARFPGRWKGPFVIGARGVRFWAPDADNTTAAVVREDGMVCYTGSEAFRSWQGIFGEHFVKKYEAEALSDIMKNSVYDGRTFYTQTDDGVWIDQPKADFSQWLRVLGKDSKIQKGQTASEIDIIESRVKQYNRVEAAMPFIYWPPGVILYKNKRYLNTSTVKPVTAAPPHEQGKLKFSDGKKLFPLIYALLTSMFDDDDSEQLTHLLAWLKYAYTCAVNHTPRPGQIIVIAGPVGKGKTFFSWQVIGGLLGGIEDASDYLVDGARWTARNLQVPVMAIDDSSALNDAKSRRSFTNRIKRSAANVEARYEEKYAKASSVPWFGRTVITCNADDESIMILPDMDVGTADKVCLFKAGSAIIEFKSIEENNRNIRVELPHFARFLLDWDYPEHVVAAERRYGVKSYHHPALFNEARAQGTGLLLELLDGFMAAFRQQFPEKEYWEGTTAQLCQDLGDHFPRMSRELNHRGVSIQLGKAAANRYRINKIQIENGPSVWRIHYDLFRMYTTEEIINV